MFGGLTISRDEQRYSSGVLTTELTGNVIILSILYENSFFVFERFCWQLWHRNLRQYPEAETVPGLLLARIGAPIYFANTQHIVERLRRFEARAQVGAPAHRHAPGCPLERRRRLRAPP